MELQQKLLRSQINASLKNINIEFHDIFYTHRFDPRCELEVLANNLEYLYEKSYLLYVGISSYPPLILKKLIKLLNERKIPTTSLQYNISLLSMSNFSICKEFFLEWGISTIAFSPLNQAILTDSYFSKSKDQDSRSRENLTTFHHQSQEIDKGLK